MLQKIEVLHTGFLSFSVLWFWNSKGFCCLLITFKTHEYISKTKLFWLSLTLVTAAKVDSSSSSPGPSTPAKASQGSALSTRLCDPSHKDCLLREFRKLCATVAENSSYNTKTQIIEKFLRKGSGGGRHVLHSLTTFHTLTRSLCRKEEDRSRFWQKTKYRVYKKTGEGTFRNVDLVNLTLADVITLNTPF